MICVKFTAFCDLRADLWIRLATLRKSVRKFYFCKLRRLASPFVQGFTILKNFKKANPTSTLSCFQ